MREKRIHLCSLSSSSRAVCGARCREGENATVLTYEANCPNCRAARPELFRPVRRAAAAPAAPDFRALLIELRGAVGLLDNVESEPLDELCARIDSALGSGK